MLLILTRTDTAGAVFKRWYDRHPYLATIVLLLLATLASQSLRTWLAPTNLVMVYLVAVVVAAIWLGYWPAVITASISTIIFAYLFVPPYFAFGQKDAQYFVTFSGLFLTGLIVSELISRLRVQNERLTAETARLTAAEERLRLSSKVFETSGEGITICDLAGTVVAVNPAFLALTGLADTDVVGRPLHRVARLPGDLRWPFAQVADGTPGECRWVGEVLGRRPRGEEYVAWVNVIAVDNDPTEHCLVTWSDVTGHRAAESRLRFLAYHDDLTHLLNRTSIESAMDRAIRGAGVSGAGFAVLFIDLDNFKTINDSLGHGVGDALLKAVAQRLRNTVREHDLVGRLGGDEFAAILKDVGSAGEARIVAEKLLQAFDEPISLANRTLSVTPSIGISVFPDDGPDAASLIKHADAAMYLAKDEGRNTYRFFRKDLRDRANERLLIENGLRRAIAEQALELWYQPQLDAASGALHGVEALVRWRHPELGLLAPGRFIAVAEASGAIIGLGDWVIGEACRQVARWRAASMPDVTVAVNLSPIQLRQPAFPDLVSARLREASVQADAIEFEVTESALVLQDEAVARCLHSLRDRGFRLAVDDFGTGYANFANLRRFPFTKLKIDQSFVRGLPGDQGNLEIVRAIISVARCLHLEFVAEGVETSDERDALSDLGCRLMQGYFFRRPAPAADFRSDFLAMP